MNQNPFNPTTPEQREAQARAVALERGAEVYRGTAYQRHHEQRRRRARAAILWTAAALLVLVALFEATGRTAGIPNNYHVHKLSPDTFLVSCQIGTAAAEHITVAGSSQLVITCKH